MGTNRNPGPPPQYSPQPTNGQSQNDSTLRHGKSRSALGLLMFLGVIAGAAAVFYGRR